MLITAPTSRPVCVYALETKKCVKKLKSRFCNALRKCCYDTFVAAGGAVDHHSGGTQPVNISVSKARGAGMQGRAVIGRAHHQFTIPLSDWKRCAVTEYDTTAVQ